MVLKPSEITPLTSLLLVKGLQEAGLPANVLQVATGRGETGRALVDEVDMVMFTGSTATGIKIAEQAAKKLTPVSLELGGKDPMIVTKDADLDRAAHAAAYWGLANGGQVCISVERVYVEEPVYEQFVQKVTDNVKDLRQGVPGKPGAVDVGAMTTPAQVDIVESHVNDAVAKGARITTGGKRRDGAGDFFEPTVLADVDHSMTCMRDETFGPTIPIMKVRDAEEAIRLANDTPYGLGASVYAGSVGDGEAIARRIDSGAACVNDALMNYFALEMPMGGVKTSGIGSRHGAGGIRKYCEQQALLITRMGMKRELQMFPYTPKVTKLLGRSLRLLYGRGRRR